MDIQSNQCKRANVKIENNNNVKIKEEIDEVFPNIRDVQEETYINIKEEPGNSLTCIKEELKETSETLVSQDFNDLDYSIKNEDLDIKHEIER